MQGLKMAQVLEFRMYEMPTIIGRTGQKAIDQLNALGAEGWRVVAPIAASNGITRTLLLEREKPAI